MLEGAIVQEMDRFFKAKADAGPERADEIKGGIGNIINTSVRVCLFMFVGTVFFGVTVLTGWTMRFWWIVLPVGFAVAFFGYCLSSIPIGYALWWFKYREAEAKQAAQGESENPPQE